MIYTDGIHLVGDSLDELHRFALSVGLKRKWFQEHHHPHYDITTSRKLRKILTTDKIKMVKTRELLKIETTMNKRQNASHPRDG